METSASPETMEKMAEDHWKACRRMTDVSKWMASPLLVEGKFDEFNMKARLNEIEEMASNTQNHYLNAAIMARKPDPHEAYVETKALLEKAEEGALECFAALRDMADYALGRTEKNKEPQAFAA